MAESAAARGALALAVLLTLCGWVITLGGLSSLQWKASDLNVEGSYIADPAATAPVVTAYTETFNRALMTPYPFAPGYQFGLEWWLTIGELPVFLLTLWLLIMPKHIARARLVVIGWLASFQMLTWITINSVLYLSRNEVATSVFGAARIRATLAGLFIVAIANGSVITILGLYPCDDQEPVQQLPAVTHKAEEGKGMQEGKAVEV